MKPSKRIGWVVFELAAVLLATAIAFTWAKETARIERGYEAYGGECVLLLIPTIYYISKQTILDWITYIRKQWCQRRCDFVIFRRTENVTKWRVKVCSL